MLRCILYCRFAMAWNIWQLYPQRPYYQKLPSGKTVSHQNFSLWNKSNIKLFQLLCYSSSLDANWKFFMVNFWSTVMHRLLVSLYGKCSILATEITKVIRMQSEMPWRVLIGCCYTSQLSVHMMSTNWCCGVERTGHNTELILKNFTWNCTSCTFSINTIRANYIIVLL